MGSSGDIFHIACYCLGNIYQFIYKRTALCCLAMYYFGDVYNAIEHRLLFLTLGGYGTKGIITEELGQCAYSIHDEQQITRQKASTSAWKMPLKIRIATTIV